MNSKIGSLIIDLIGIALTAEEREILAHPLVGGVILFSRNYASLDQLKKLCADIRLSRQQPLLIMVDQEGGRVQRFVDGFTRIPPMGTFGERYVTDPDHACQLAKDCGFLLATELLSVGIDLSLAPVIDLNKGINTVIGDRAFHHEPQAVVHLARAFIQGMQQAGMAATGKHFPGHGSVKQDSHAALPVDMRTWNEIEREDLVPFAQLIQAGIPSVMAAHIVFPLMDHLPAGFSRYWLKTILRDRLGFQGIILSDDLNMEGANISADFSDRVKAAKEAGCDFTLLCNNRPAVVHVLDGLPYQSQMVSEEKWGMLRATRYNRMTEHG